MGKTRKRFFFLSTIISLALHAFFLYCIQFSGLYNIYTEKSLSKEEERDFLQTVFSNTAVQKKLLLDVKNLPKPDESLPLAVQTDKFELKENSAKPMQNSISSDKEIEKRYVKDDPKPKKKLLLKQEVKTSLFEKIAQEAPISAVKKRFLNKKPLLIDGKNIPIVSSTIDELKAKRPYVFNAIKSFEYQKSHQLVKAKTAVPEKGKLNIKRKKKGFQPFFEKKTKSCAEDFDIDIAYLPKEDGNGYLFSITLIPKPFVDFPKIKQNFFFLVDRSNAIGKRRFHVTQTAVLKALSHLSDTDTFNVLAFDNRTELFSPYNIKYSKSGIVKAKRFLDELSLGNIFSTSDITQPLYSVLSYPANEDQLNIAILLTNGDGITSVFKNRKIVDNWTAENNGKVSLYSVVLDTDVENLRMKMFAASNTGKMITSTTTRGIKRKLQKLMKSIQHPIAKDVHLTALSMDGKKHIELSSHLRPPHIYLDDPYVIIGSVDTLDDFYLFIQGKQNDQLLNIKKKISFEGAKAASKSIKKEWAMQKAFEQYQLFIKDNDPRHLQVMRSYLSPFEIEISF